MKQLGMFANRSCREPYGIGNARTEYGAQAPRERRLACWWPLLVVAALASVASAFAADLPVPEMLQVLEPQPEGPRITPFLSYQLERAWAFDAARQERWARVQTEADLRALQDEVRRKALDVIGGLPGERTPLNARVTATIPMDGYRIEKLVFESLPGIHVTALLYVPDGPGRKPAVLVACGHSAVGKAFVNYQEIAARLARRGYVVLCWDPVGQGERSQFWDQARGRSRYNLICGEHAVLGNLATLAGTSLVRYMVWDGMRALDYLLGRDVHGLVPFQRPIMAKTNNAFCACRRFSASSNTSERSLSKTSSVISSPRCAGRQCITTA